MTTLRLESILTAQDIDYIHTLPDVRDAYARLDVLRTVYFKIALTGSLRSTLQSRLGLDLENVSEIPMRWIKGDTQPHVDMGQDEFKKTYLVYLNGSEGDLVIGNDVYPIEANTAFVFDEGVSHKTEHTGNAHRLLIGPMNEMAQPVGTYVYYYASENDAVNYLTSSPIGAAGSYIVISVGDIIYWRIASSSTGPSPQSVVYSVGDDLNSGSGGGTYYMYPASACFLEGTRVLTLVNGIETYVPIEKLDTNSLVKTSRDGYKKIELIGRSTIKNPGNDLRLEDRLYRCPVENYPELDEDLYITGCHSILVDSLTDIQKKQTKQYLGKLYVTDKKYRLMAVVDERAHPWVSEGVYTVWHLALENDDDGINHGIFVNGGLLAETCSIRFLRQKLDMILHT